MQLKKYKIFLKIRPLYKATYSKKNQGIREKWRNRMTMRLPNA